MSKENILITGAGPNGVTGRRIKEFLEKLSKYNILAPSSKELDLTDFYKVNNYFHENEVDYVIHCAVLAPSRNHDDSDPAEEIESNLRMFLNITYHTPKIKKIFYIGSGAEFDKRDEIINIREEDFPKNIPADKYGFTKYVLNSIAAENPKICNLRVFGTINPYEPKERNVVSFICDRAAQGLEIKLNQNCRFSFMDIDDLARFIDYGIGTPLLHGEYNMVGVNCEIREIAEYIRNQMFPELNIEFKYTGLAKEYTGNNKRLLSEDFIPTKLGISLMKVLDYYRNNVYH